MALLLFNTACVDDNYLLDDRELWIGTWTCNEIEGDFAPQSYQVEFIEKVNQDKISIKGLYNQGSNFTLYAEIEGNNLNIPLQTVNNITIAGSGVLDKDVITLFFNADDGSGVDVVKAGLFR